MSEPDPNLLFAHQVKRRTPVVSLVVCVLSAVAFLRVQMGGGTDAFAAYRAAGWRPAAEVWSGSQWALLTSVFVHGDTIHLVFCLSWTWKLGEVAEEALGRVRYALFLVLAGLVSSTAQMVIGGDTGVGASGMLYGAFGLMWAGRAGVPLFAAWLTSGMIRLWLGWQGLCYVLTWTGVYPIGNTAHVAGLLFGAAVGAAFLARRALPWSRIAVFAGITGAAVLSVWCPWSPGWAASRAIRAHLDGEYASAAEWYERSAALGGDRTWTLENLVLVHDGLRDGAAVDRDLAALAEHDPAAARTFRESAAGAPAAAASAYRGKEFAEAERLYRIALAAGHSPAHCWYGMACAQIAMGHLADARASQANVRAADPALAAELDSHLPK